MSRWAAGLLLAAPIAAGGLTHQLVRATGLLQEAQLSLDDLLFQGRPLFGRNKTLRGFLVLPLACGLAFTVEWLCLRRVPGLLPAPTSRLWRYPPLTGALVGFAVVLAELPNSFVKRRLGIAPGGRATRGGAMFFLVDQLDSAVGAGLALHALSVPWSFVVAGLAVAPLLHAGLNFASHAIGLRTSPR
ncbi:MAG: CDP-archaeol synthase [Deltaproteobacteria bacterium]